MNIIIKPRNLSGKIKAIASKSYAHRALICAALANNVSNIVCDDLSEDICATVNCLNNLGANITREENIFTVKPIIKAPKSAEIDCGESGSTLRFLLPVIGALGIDAKIKMHGRLPNRPLSPLWEQMIENGCSLQQNNDVLHCHGKLKATDYTIAGNISSQFITGLLFALPLLDDKSRIIITGEFESQSYVKLTLDVMKKFGLSFDFCDNIFEINPQKYNSNDLQVEGDWSNSAFWLCADKLSEKGIAVENLNYNSVQGDKNIVELLNSFFDENNSNEIIVDAQDIPDLVPIISVIASAKGNTVIKNAGRLRIKESDRIKTVVNMINNLGGKAEETSDGMFITGVGALSGGTVDACGDHRISMSAAIASIICETDVKIIGAEAVNKSYPRFFDDFKKLGGEYETEGLCE